MTALTTALAGFGLMASLLVAIGAQNAYVLRQGLRGEHVPAVVLVCSVSDTVLIVAGVAGAGAALSRAEHLVDVIRVVGALALLAYAALAIRRVIRTESFDVGISEGTPRLLTVVSTALALTWFNPHVYLDTILLVGSVSQGYASPWAFGVGAALASITWFVVIGFGARYLRPLFTKQRAWQVLDSVIAAIMITIAVTLVVPLL
jgi:L-lysine exporter family protein LysE/ArgO